MEPTRDERIKALYDRLDAQQRKDAMAIMEYLLDYLNQHGEEAFGQYVDRLLEDAREWQAQKN
jgi:hypothetical protein